MTTYLEADTKFWEITVDGDEFTVRFGKLGAAGSSNTKSWPSEEKCQKEADKLIRAKTNKGYSPASGGGGGGGGAKKASAKKAAPKAAKAAPKAAKSPAKKGGKALAGCIFCISGSLSKSKSEMTSLIEGAGGTVGSNVTRATTHLLTSDADFIGGTGKVSKARGQGIPILHEDFVFDSVKAGKQADADDYNMSDMHGGDDDEEEAPPPKKKAKTAAKSSGGGGAKTHLEADSKFWEITVSGSSFTTRYGKLGAAGASSTKDWDSAEKCQKEADKLIRQKRNKGYE